MAKFFEELNDSLIKFISEQKIFFTGSAAENGRVNVSPKGIDTFRCLDSKTAAYLDLTGSGNETAAHVAKNGRLTIMFCSFTEKSLILRLYGRGEIIRPHHPQWENFSSHFKSFFGERQIVILHVESLQTSCGFGVPIFELKEERSKLVEWAENKGTGGIADYWSEKNVKSIDGFPTNIFE